MKADAAHSEHRTHTGQAGFDAHAPVVDALALRLATAVSAAVQLVLLVSLFAPWDAGRRSSFELLAVVQRSGLLPASIPATALLLWWVLQPVLLTAGVALSVGLASGRYARLRWIHEVGAVAAALTTGGIGWIVTQAPGATAGPSVTAALSATSAAAVAGCWLLRRRAS